MMIILKSNSSFSICVHGGGKKKKQHVFLSEIIIYT